MHIIITAFILSRVAEDDSEVEDENKSGEKAVQPRDSGCFESSDNLEGRREEPKTEEGLGDERSEEKMKQEEQQEQEQREDEQVDDVQQQVDDVQQQLQQLTVDEES